MGFIPDCWFVFIAMVAWILDRVLPEAHSGRLHWYVFEIDYLRFSMQLFVVTRSQQRFLIGATQIASLLK